MKLELREAKELAQGHTASTCQHWDLMQVGLTCHTISLTVSQNITSSQSMATPTFLRFCATCQCIEGPVRIHPDGAWPASAAARDSCLWSGHWLWNNPLLLASEEADVSECHFLIKETIHLPLPFDLSWNNSHKSPGNADTLGTKWKSRKSHLSLIHGKKRKHVASALSVGGCVIFRKEHFVI